ncbi:MAG: SusD/RagB family nutrient-binding outer membrane lipoprotein [Bacteroides sp.]|nr:SusD/RagB family nutrient-binding outer membrane lipoprotein [Bacteroides sp.]
MKYMKKYILIPILSVLMLLNTSCDDYLDVNTNIDSPDYIEDYLYLSGIQQSFQDVFYDLTYAILPMISMWSSTQTTYGYYYGNHYYPQSVDTGALIWRTIYWNHGMNLENLIHQALNAKRYHLAGIGYAIKAYGWDMLTKVYGEVPLKQAFDNERVLFDYDYQPDIYDAVRVWAYKAIEYMDMDDSTNYGAEITSNDWIYKGDIDKWRKFAYGVLVRNLSSLSNKSDFTTKYADELINAATKALQSYTDDAMVEVAGGSGSVPYTGYNNFWGTQRGNLSTIYYQHDYMVQLMTGTIPKYDVDGKRVKQDNPSNPYYQYELLEQQYITDTLVHLTGHYDPRVAVKLSTDSDPEYLGIDDPEIVKSYEYYGGQNNTTRTNPGGQVTTPHLYGRTVAVKNSTTTLPNDGIGRWIFRDNAPYVLMTAAEIKLCLAEAYWKKGDITNAYNAFKAAIRADLDFTVSLLYPATKGVVGGGDKITKSVYDKFADEYYAGPYVEGLGENNLTLSHIMMQKFVALYPWGGIEAWTDLRKYHYDINYTNGYPSKGNGWDDTRLIEVKRDEDPNKVFKGYFLGAARDIEFRNVAYNIYNDGSPCYRIRPRYNSEYMWNIESLEKLKPIAGTAPDYHCSIPWFAYPDEYPTN